MFSAPIPITYKPTFGRKKRTGLCLEYVCADVDRERVIAFMIGLTKVIGGGSRVGESDDSVDLYIIDTPRRSAQSVLLALAKELNTL